MPEQNRNLVQVPLSQLNEYLQKGYRPAPLQQYELENTMPREEEMGLMGSVGRGLVASGLDVVGAGANWSRAAAQITKLQPLEDIGFSVDKYVDDLIARKFSLPPDVKDFDPTDSRWWGYHIARMAPQIGVQYGIMAGLAAFGVPAPIGMALGAGFGGFMEGAGAIEESLAKGDRGWAPITKGLGMGSAAILTNYISMGNVGKIGGSGIFGKLLRMSVSGGWEMGTEAIEEPINDLIVYGRLQPNLLKRMAIVGLPSFVLGSGTHVISRIGKADPTTKPPDPTKGFTATGKGGVPVYSTGEPIPAPAAGTGLDDVPPDGGGGGGPVPPWMMRSVEYAGKLEPEKYPPIRLPNGRMARNPEASKAQARILIRKAQHARLVKEAVEDGKQVPPAVLEEYATGPNKRDWAVIAYRKALGLNPITPTTEPTESTTEPTTEPTAEPTESTTESAAEPTAAPTAEPTAEPGIEPTTTSTEDLAINYIEAIEAAETNLPDETFASHLTTKEQEIIIGNELLQSQPDLTPDEFDAIVDDLIAQGELSPDTLKSAEWLLIAEFIRAGNNSFDIGQLVADAVNAARPNQTGMNSISYMDAMKLKTLVEQVIGVQIDTSTFIKDVASSNALNIRAPHFIPGVTKVFTPELEAQLIKFFGHRLTTEHQRSTLLNLLEKLVWNAMHAIGYDPAKYFRESFLGLHTILYGGSLSALGLPYDKIGFGGTWNAFASAPGTMPVYQDENYIMDITRTMDPRPASSVNQEGAAVTAPNLLSKLTSYIGVRGGVSTPHILFHEMAHIIETFNGVDIPEFRYSPLAAALKRVYGSPSQAGYFGNKSLGGNLSEDFAEFLEYYTWSEDHGLGKTGDPITDKLAEEFLAFQKVMREVYKERPPSNVAIHQSPFMDAVMRALFTGDSITVLFDKSIPVHAGPPSANPKRPIAGMRRTGLKTYRSAFAQLDLLKSRAMSCKALCTPKALRTFRKNITTALKSGLRSDVRDNLPSTGTNSIPHVLDALLKYARGAEKLLNWMEYFIADIESNVNNADPGRYTAEDIKTINAELSEYREAAAEFRKKFVGMLEKEFNKLEQANGGSRVFKELAIAKAIKAHTFPKKANLPSITELPSAEEDLTPSDMELRRKDRLVKRFARKAITVAQLNDPKFIAERDAKIKQYIHAGFLPEETLTTEKIKAIVQGVKQYLSTSTSTSISARDVLSELARQLVTHDQAPKTSADIHLGPDPATKEPVILKSPLTRLTFEDATILHRLLRDNFAKPGTKEWEFNYFLEQVGELNRASQPSSPKNTYRLALDIKMPAAPNYALPKPDYVLPFGVRKQIEHLLNRSAVHSKKAIEACIRTLDRYYHNILSGSNIENPRAFLRKYSHDFWRSPGAVAPQDLNSTMPSVPEGYAFPEGPNVYNANSFDTSFDGFMGVVTKDVSFTTLVHETTQYIQSVADKVPGSQLGAALKRIHESSMSYRTKAQAEDMSSLMESLILNGTFLRLNGPDLDPILQKDLRIIRDELLAYFNIARIAVTPSAQATFLMNALLGGESIMPFVYDLDSSSGSSQELQLPSDESLDPDLIRQDDILDIVGKPTDPDLIRQDDILGIVNRPIDPDLIRQGDILNIVNRPIDPDLIRQGDILNEVGEPIDPDLIRRNADLAARIGAAVTARELVESFKKGPTQRIVDKSGRPFNLRTVAGQKGFLASLHTPGHWDEWAASGRELAIALVNEGNPVDIIADWISKGRAMNTRIMSALHHIKLLLSHTLPPINEAEDEIIRQNFAIPGRVDFVNELVMRVNSEAGRTLNEAKRQAQLREAVIMLDGLLSTGRLLTELRSDSPVYLEFREKLIESEEPMEELNKFLQLYEKSKVTHNIIMSLFYNSLLSNPSTHVANTLFNGVWGLALSPHRAVVGMVDSVWSAVTGRPRTIFAGEGLSLLRGYAAHFRDPEWNKAFKTMWSREGMIDSITKTEEEMGLVYRGELRKDAITAFLEGKGSVAKLLGNVVTAPSRFLIAMDAWAKAIAERGQEEALRYRFTQYTGEQLTRAKVDFIKSSLSNLRLSDVMLRRYNIRHLRHLNVILEDPVEIGRRIDNLFEAAVKNEMARFAEHATFQDEPGAMTRALLSLRSRSGPLGRMLVPFLQTIMNITKRGLELTPGVGVLMGVHQSLSPQEIAAKQIESLILTAIIYSLLQSGKITGPPPEDPGEREVFYAAGMQPWAIRVGDKYYSYRSIEPFALPVSIITEQYGKWVNQEDERLSLDTFLSSFITVRDHLVGNTFLRTVDAMLGKEWDLKNQLWWTTASFVPFSGFWRGMKRQYEDWAYDKVAIRDNTFMSVFGDSLPPGLAGLVQGEPKISAMGEPIYRENAGLRFLPREWLPIRATEYKPDRVEQLFMDVGYYPRYPSQKIKLVDKGPYVTIPDDLYKDYIIAVGQKGKRELDRLASRPYFNSMPTKRKTDLVISTWNKVRDREREKVKVMLRRQRITSKAYGSRADGTLKGKGFLGELSIGKGRVATEYSIGVKIDGKETEIPSLVPTLTQAELELMLTDIIPNKKTPPTSIIQKAVDHAKKRMRQGLSPFAE